MTVAQEVEVANAKYAASFTKGDLALPPQRKVTIVACMDARLDVARALGLEEGHAHVIRNAGGRVTDALRSIIISQQLLVYFIFTDDAIRNKIRSDLNQNADHIAFLPFGDLKQSVLDDIKSLKESSLVLDVPITGYIYEVETGKIVRV